MRELEERAAHADETVVTDALIEPLHELEKHADRVPVVGLGGHAGRHLLAEDLLGELQDVHDGEDVGPIV